MKQLKQDQYHQLLFKELNKGQDGGNAVIVVVMMMKLIMMMIMIVMIASTAPVR